MILLVSLMSVSAAENSTLKSDLLRELRNAERKALALADAIPAEKYSWRPAEGVRSVSEVYIHLVTNKHFLLGFTGVPVPGGMSRDLEKTATSKDEVTRLIRAAYKKAIGAIETSDPADWDQPVERFFWKPATRRTVYLRLVVHSNEHIGQLVSYARMMGVTPPWSR
ncbi:MAG: DinB family protein [bacterium]|nr:DinB family protein [bacterium]